MSRGIWKEQCEGCGEWLEFRQTARGPVTDDICSCETDCNHEGLVVKGECERCGETGLETDGEIYERENPR